MNDMETNNYITVRELFFCRKGEQQRSKLTIRIKLPYLVNEGTVNFNFDEGTSICEIEFVGLSELNTEVFGVDKLHALSLAVDVDPFIRRMTKDYEFYWLDGEPYFDD